MAIEQLFGALPLHYLQHGISKFGGSSIAFAVFATAIVGVLADYAWMLYLRSKMVCSYIACLVDSSNVTATRATTVPPNWQHLPASR